MGNSGQDKGYLLDTCAILFAALRPEMLSPLAVRILSDPEVRVYVSPVSLWEIGLKVRIGKIGLGCDLPEFLIKSGLAASTEELPLTWADSMWSERLPGHHADPFDRMLIAQAIEAGLTLLTKDRWIAEYSEVRVAW